MGFPGQQTPHQGYHPTEKRDINGTRYGFIHTYNIPFAQHLVNTFSGKYLLKNKLTFKLNPIKSRPHPPSVHKQPSPSSTRSPNVATSQTQQLLVPQPSHRTITLNIKIDKTQELKRSWLGLTQTDHWADTLQEFFFLKTQIHVKIIGIIQMKFLITFWSSEEKEDLSPLLGEWFQEIRHVKHLDLVLPILAWVYCDGLPFSV